jgi:integrase
MNALVFLYKRILDHAMEGSINAVQADKKVNVPVVMTRDEVAAVISLLDGTAQLVAKLLYGSGLRIMEAVRLRVEVRGHGCLSGPPEMAGRGSYLRSLWAIESTAVVHGADMG